MFADVVREVAALDDAGLADYLDTAARDLRAVEAELAVLWAEADRRGLHMPDDLRASRG